jgi:predicted nucleic acid-binding protein
VKLVLEEAETEPLREAIRSDADQLSSAIVEIEVVRAARRRAPELAAQAERVLEQLVLVEPTPPIRARAALLGPATLRALDALHVATALEVREELDALVTDYQAWYARAINVLPDELQPDFVDRYEGGLVITRIKAFLYSPGAPNALFNPGVEALVAFWQDPYEEAVPLVDR